jgi:hypothetical protein
MASTRHIFLAMPLLAGLFTNSACALDASPRQAGPETAAETSFCKNQVKGKILARTELFFGLSKPGGVVTEEEFQHFVDTEVTPRFPEGLTLLAGYGQYQTSTGVILKEGSKLLILLYTFDKKKNKAIEAIRTAYKKTFQQESVLRADGHSCASF